jgi:hypothetical protein
MSSQELPVNGPLTRIEVENLQAQVLDQVPGEARHVALTPQQVRTADEVFARDRESKQVIGMLGLWTGALLLHDIAVDTFTTTEEEEEKPKQNENPEL